MLQDQVAYVMRLEVSIGIVTVAHAINVCLVDIMC